MERMISSKEILRVLSISRMTLYRWRKEGILTAHKVKRKLMFKESDVEELIERNKVDFV